MSAGLPGLGLGGIFFLVSALLAPFVELVRTARGQSSLASWLGVGRQFGLAVAMIVAVDGVLRLVYLLGSVAGLGDGHRASATVALPVLPLLITLSLLALVLAAAKGMELGARAGAGEFAWMAPAGRLPTRSELVGGIGVLTVVWLALLTLGASNLSTPLAAVPPFFGGGDGSGEELVSAGDRPTRAAGAPTVAERPLPDTGDEAGKHRRRRGSGGGGAARAERSQDDAGASQLAQAAPVAPPAPAGGSYAPAPRSPGSGGGPSGGGAPARPSPPPPGNGQGRPGGSGPPASPPGSGSGPAPGSGSRGGPPRGSPPAMTPSGRDVPATGRRAAPEPANRSR